MLLLFAGGIRICHGGADSGAKTKTAGAKTPFGLTRLRKRREVKTPAMVIGVANHSSFACGTMGFHRYSGKAPYQFVELAIH
jgi:hypothetical protein